MSGKIWNEYYSFSNVDLSTLFKYSSFSIFVLLVTFIVFILFMKKNNIRYKTKDYLLVIFLLITPFLVIKFVFVDAFQLKDTVENNKCKIIVGIINNFKNNVSKSGSDSFYLSNKSIKVGGIGNYGFNQTKALGSPIRNGLPVKICYVEFYGNLRILKLEIQN